jgi:hypothetical protein
MPSFVHSTIYLMNISAHRDSVGQECPTYRNPKDKRLRCDDATATDWSDLKTARQPQRSSPVTPENADHRIDFHAMQYENGLLSCWLFNS